MSGKRKQPGAFHPTWGGRVKHGHSPAGSVPSITYKAWVNMTSRCKYPTSKSWKYCGGRGITMCERWKDFANFLADMGERPSPAHSLDRINNDGNYEPGNCRWATLAEQRRNMRQNINITIDGRTMCATDWAVEKGIKPATVLARITKLGWDPVLAVTEVPTHRRSLYRGGKRITP